MVRGELLYEGKAKRVYQTERDDVLLVSYKDDATAFNGQKRGTIVGKGAINNQLSNAFFRQLEASGVPTHWLEAVGERETLVRRLTMLPIEVVVRNVAAGSLASRLGLEEGGRFPRPVVELYYKRDDLGDPLINDDHALVLGLATAEELAAVKQMALQVNEVLQGLLERAGMLLVDFKLEFGRTVDGQLVLGDEISPDTCRFWDLATGERLDKDRFRRDLGRVEEAYQEVFRRIQEVV
ncbi:MAG: phosphoribosylaminoimidazolesuccinocarboxamide synthase [Alicyclobacillus sp.]|nr:phosphoribosylaminoimidazolesuccinocarboxamide synthase [Alicyclobacillus sp.]